MSFNNFFHRIFYSFFLFISLLFSNLSAQGIILTGHVYTGVQSNGALIPVEGAQVAIALDSVPEGTMAFSDGEGYYELPFEWNWNGPIPVSCQAEGYEFYIAEIIPNSDTNSLILEYDIYLTPMYNDVMTVLEGHVWQDNGCLGGPVGCPIAGADISAVPMNSPADIAYNTISNDDGHYLLELPEGAYMVSCSAEGWQTETVDLEIGAQGATFDFHLPEANNMDVFFSGRVWGEVGPMLPAFEPIASANVILYGGFTGGILAETLTSDDGYFEFSDVVWSATAVSVHADGFIDQEFGIYDLCSDIDPTNTECFPLEHDFYMALNDVEPECEDLSGFNFGTCEMIIGYGWNGEECTWFSGCGTVDEDGIDHAGSFFDSMDGCNAACSDVVSHGALAGEVFYQWGDAIEVVVGALIQVNSSSGFMFATETNENGFYLIEEIPVGNYAVTCTVYTGETMTQEVEITAGTSFILDFWFGEPDYQTILTGTVYSMSTDASFIPETHIIAHNAQGEMFDTWSLESSEYWLPLPASGDYFVTAEAEGYFSTETAVYVDGVTLLDFYLTPIDDYMDPDAILSLGEASGSPGSIINVPFYIESSETVAGIQFTLADDPNLLTLEMIGDNTDDECWTINSNDFEGAAIYIAFSLTGCTLEPGDYLFDQLYFRISDDAASGTEIGLFFTETIVAGPQGNEIFSEGSGTVVTVGAQGDINGDGAINVLDVVSLVNFILFVDDPTDSEFWAGDLNQDNNLNVLDVVLMVNIILGEPVTPDECYLEPDIGPCDGSCPMYYFDPASGSCEVFFWGCCEGVVPFESYEDCVDQCQ